MTKQRREVDWGDIPLAKATKREVDWGTIQQHPVSQGMQHLQQLGHALGGGALGLAQGASDIGANIAHFPSDIYEYFKGKPLYNTPKPDIREFAPSSQTGQSFEKGGEFLAPFLASPTLAAESAIGKGLYGGRMLPRLITDLLGGAAEGEGGNRIAGAAFGAATPLVGGAKRWVRETPFTERGATKKLEKAKSLAGEKELGIPLGIDFLRNLEYQLGSSQLKPSKMQINTLLGNAAKGDYKSFNELQSALGDVSRGLVSPPQKGGNGLMGIIQQYLSKPQTTAPERLTADQLNKLRHQYISEAMEHLRKTRNENIANLSEKGREDYRRYKQFVPKRNALIAGLLGSSIPGYHAIKHFFE